MDQESIEISIELDLEKQKSAKLYARIKRRLMLVDLCLSSIYVLAWLLLKWSNPLKSWLRRFTNDEWLLVLLFVIFFGGIFYIFNLPLSFYQGYILPHRFALSNQKLSGWIADEVKGIFLGGILGLIMLEIIYSILREFPNTWWLWASAILLVFNVILENIAPILIMPIFNKFVPLGEEYTELVERLTILAKHAGTDIKGVYKFDMSKRTKQANAGLTGLGNTRRIILGDTLLTEFTPDEIETVMAHELGHQVNKDIPLGIIFGSFITLIGLYLASVGLRWGVTYFDFDGVADIAALPLFLLVLGLYGLVTLPLGNAFSRWREKRADAYALSLTGKGKAYASALKRLANQNLADTEPEAWVEWLLYSHPALGKRIAMAECQE